MQAVDIVDVLQDVVGLIGASPALTLTHGTRFEQNKEADNATFPKVYLDEPLRSRETLSSMGNAQVVYPVALFFADKAILDATPAQQRVTILQMRTYAKEFITRIQSYTYTNGRKAFNFDNGLNYTITDVVNLPYDVGLTGCLLEMDFPIINYGTICIV
jgi:protein-disulfide isomerase-like protein with CxxC motif